MQDRPTKTIETPEGKHKVVLYEYANGGDKRALGGLKESGLIEALIERLVVSINGSEENLLDLVDLMHGKDFDFIATELAEVLSNSSLSQEKKTP